MTPKMEDALLAAYTAGEEGLHWTVAGWAGPNDRIGDPYHAGVIVSRLVFDRGFLDATGPKSGPRQRRVINAAGIAYVEKHLRTEAVQEAEDLCPVCDEPFKLGDQCATDIELGMCHAQCLEGAPTVDLTTGEPIDGPIPSYPYATLAPKEQAR